MPAEELDLAEAVAVLERTPGALRALLEGLPEAWIRCDEGPDSWSAFDVVGHLIHGERTDWMSRLRIVLEHGPDQPFEPFDRFAMLELSRGRGLEDLLDEFERLRGENLEALERLGLTPADWGRQGRHPDLGLVTLSELLAAWVVHDLGHLAQIGRVMAKRYRETVGPWRVHLPVVDR